MRRYLYSALSALTGNESIMLQSSARSLSRLKKGLIAGFLGLAIAGFALEIYLDGYYCRSRPTTPQPSEGRVVRHVVCHGTVVYLTRKEDLAFGVVIPSIFIASFAIGALVYSKLRRPA